MKPTFLLIAVLFLASCNWNRDAQDVSVDSLTLSEPIAYLSAPSNVMFDIESEPPYTREEEKQAPGETLAGDIPKDKKKIIREGNLTIRTPDLAQAKKDIDSLVLKNHAYYQSEEFENNNSGLNYDLVIRIPFSDFENFITGMEQGNGEIIAKSIEAQDVTEEYIDVETRLANKRIYLARYKELLKQAFSVKDILALQENIRVLQEEIESREGRLKYLDDRVSYSTLEVSLVKNKEFVYKPQPQDRFTEQMKSSMFTGWISMVNFILWTFKHWPMLILSVVAIALVRRFRIKRRKEKQANH
jgi:Domain of unknown function (DUF4349)